MIANNCSVVNKYIQSAEMNGQPLNTPWFAREQLISGETSELEMGSNPNKSWGSENRQRARIFNRFFACPDTLASQ